MIRIRSVLCIVFFSIPWSINAGQIDDSWNNDLQQNQSLRFRVGECTDRKWTGGKSVQCIEIYSTPRPELENLIPISEISGVIRNFSGQESFGICGDSGVENQIFSDVLDLAHGENIVHSVLVGRFPCI